MYQRGLYRRRIGLLQSVFFSLPHSSRIVAESAMTSATMRSAKGEDEQRLAVRGLREFHEPVNLPLPLKIVLLFFARTKSTEWENRRNEIWRRARR